MEYYVIFALSVGIWSVIEWVPRMRAYLFERNRLDDVMYSSPLITVVVMFTISTLIAPLVVLNILVPQLNQKVFDGLVAKR
jgi:hypothetical protein